MQFSDIPDKNGFEYEDKQGYRNKSNDHASKEYYKNSEFTNVRVASVVIDRLISLEGYIHQHQSI